MRKDARRCRRGEDSRNIARLYATRRYNESGVFRALVLGRFPGTFAEPSDNYRYFALIYITDKIVCTLGALLLEHFGITFCPVVSYSHSNIFRNVISARRIVSTGHKAANVKVQATGA